jgi:KaiC/GvpD/RAD55 family RecA-like ATPase
MTAQPEWTDNFQRTLLRLACDTALPGKVPGAFTAQLFGADDGGQGRGPSPRVRIARVIEQYWKDYGSPATVVIIEELLQRDLARISEEQRTAVLNEWDTIQETLVPTNTSFAVKEIILWAEQQRFTQGLLQAADAIDRGSIDTARELMARAMAPIEESEEQREIALVADAEERLALWRQGDVRGKGIPTGLPELDRCLSGGPKPGEFFVVLAPPKGLKTAFLMNFCLGAIKARHNTYLETFEMKGINMLLRADRSLARATAQELYEDQSLLVRPIKGLIASGAGELWAYQSNPQVPNAVANTSRRIDKLRKAGHRIDMVVFDYLNILGASTKEKEKRHELARSARDMAAMSKNEGLVVWSAALTKREAENKLRIVKTDVAESYEVMAVVDGAVAVCGTPEMRAMGLRLLYLAAMREEEDQKEAGIYHCNREKMTIFPASDAEILHAQVLSQPDAT